MRTLEDFMNKLTDMDSGWWPFLYLRPSKDEEIDNATLLKMAICFGPLYGSLLASLAWFITRQFSPWAIVGNIVFMSIAFFLIYKFTFAIFWNRRVRRMRASSAPSNES
jgi:hypothetical protein